MLGCDIVDIDRIEKVYQNFGDVFAKKLLTDKELEIYTKRSNKVEFLAGRFSAKEAIVKAIGSGFDTETWFTDIEILPDEQGKPIVYINNVERLDLEVSISHSRLCAMAVCIIKGDA